MQILQAFSERVDRMNSGIFDNKRPLYQVVAEALIEGIEKGNYPVGELLPSEAQLCSEHNVSRHTARAAIRELADRGMVNAQPGVGTRVISRRIGNYAQSMKEISDLTGYVKETTRNIISRGRIVASEAEINLPGDPGAEWEMFEAVRQVIDSDRVIAWTCVFVPTKYAETLDEVSPNELLYPLIEEHFGVRTNSLRQAIKAVGCAEKPAKWLELEIGSPALSVVREYISAEGEVYEVSWSIHPPERYENKMELALSH